METSDITDVTKVKSYLHAFGVLTSKVSQPDCLSAILTLLVLILLVSMELQLTYIGVRRESHLAYFLNAASFLRFLCFLLATWS